MMRPFKGQGANQTLLDALALSREIARIAEPYAQWKTAEFRERVLTSFESVILKRSASKVKNSAYALQFLHLDTALLERDEPRNLIKNNEFEQRE